MNRNVVVVLALALGGCWVSAPYAPAEPPPEPTPGPAPDPRPAPTPSPTVPEAGVTDAPLRGGSMTLLYGGNLVAIDASTGLLAVIDPDADGIVASTNLDPRDEPGRVVEDSTGALHVVLRAAGELLTLSPELEPAARRAVCQTPRGVVYDEVANQVLVACASGELVSFAPAGGEPVQTVMVQPDLRDLVISDGVLYASVFRAATLLTLERDGSVVTQRTPRSVSAERFSRDPEAEASFITLDANTAYRLRAMPDGRVLMVHQRSVSSPIDVEGEGYSGGMCRSGVVETAVSVFAPGLDAPHSRAIGLTALPLDGAYVPETDEVLVVSGANDSQHFVPTYWPRRIPLSAVPEGECHFPEATFAGFDTPYASTVAVEVLADGRVAIQRRGGPVLVDVLQGRERSLSVPHPEPARPHPGSEVFHAQTGTGLACASCHPEAGEDGFTWDFIGTGPRRTQSLLGGLLATAPFHWSGDQPSLTEIMRASFTERMGGQHDASDTAALGLWLDAQPMPEGPVYDEAAWARGRDTFQASCAGCHAGEALTNNESVDIGTGGAFQVPSLRGVAYRAPFMHDGCAGTFGLLLQGACNTASTHAVASAERPDLQVYLESL